jgi:hypothetical protein
MKDGMNSKVTRQLQFRYITQMELACQYLDPVLPMSQRLFPRSLFFFIYFVKILPNVHFEMKFSEKKVKIAFFTLPDVHFVFSSGKKIENRFYYAISRKK